MKALFVIIAASACATSAYAFECPAGQEHPLMPIRWSAEGSASAMVIRLGVENASAKEVRMVDARVWFEDGLGRLVPESGIELDPDLRIAGSAGNIAELYSGDAVRLLDAKMEDFTPHICTTAILFADGSKEEF